VAVLNRRVGVVLVVLIGFVAFAGVLFVTQQKPSGFEVILASNGQVLISDDDVSTYNATSHELNLSANCIARMKGMELHHVAFEVRLDGRLLGNGSFWSEVDSMFPPSGITILDIVLIHNGHATSIWMETCYPSGSYVNCTTPAFSGDLAAHFQSLGKLVD